MADIAKHGLGVVSCGVDNIAAGSMQPSLRHGTTICASCHYRHHTRVTEGVT